MVFIEQHPAFDFTNGMGQRQESFRFRLIEGATGLLKGEIHPIDGSVSLSHSVESGAGTRSMSMALGESDSERIDPIRDRVIVDMLVGGEVWPLGRYLFSADTQQDFWDPDDLGNPRLLSSPSLEDSMRIVDTELERGFAVETDYARPAIERLMRPLRLETQVDDSPFEVNNSWMAGTSRKSILGTLAELGGLLSPWFDHQGVLRVKRQFDPEVGPADFDFDRSRNVIAESVTRSNSAIDEPNRYVVVANGGVVVQVTDEEGGTEDVALDPGPMLAFADIPATAPHSVFNLGYVRPQVFEMQVVSQAQAQAIADRMALTAQVAETAEVSTALDPRHDGWNTVQFQGKRWIETGWSMQLQAGGVMRHSLRRTYPPSPPTLFEPPGLPAEG